MHELSIALSMIEMASEESVRRGNARVLALHLKLGPLSGVVKEALLFSYDIACEGTALAGSRLVVEDVPVTIYCAVCDAECNPPSIQQISCSKCGTPSEEIRQGRELLVTALELDG